MRKIVITSLALFLPALCATAAPQVSSAGDQGRPSQNSRKPLLQKSSSIFNKIESVLHSNSRVPMRLPSYLPDVDEKHPIYPVIESANSSSYDVLLAVILPCDGQNNCLYGSVEGRESPFDSVDGAKIPVKLEGSINGEFIESVCAAYCSEAYVRWGEDGFYYSIGIKAGKMKSMIKVANSAIATAHMAKH